ncbi:short transient receptor potential channel 4-like [Ixodes scapularis]
MRQLARPRTRPINVLARTRPINVLARARPGPTVKSPSPSQAWAFGLGRTLKYLFWAVYELGQPEYADVVVPGDARGGGKLVTHDLTEFVGYSLWGLYHVITVVVLLNVLIAMMTNTFQRVEGNAYVEWIFARSSQWISYLDIQAGVPPPFNLFPTAGCLRLIVSWRCSKGQKGSSCYPQTWDFEGTAEKEGQMSYQDLVLVLSRRILQMRDTAERELFEVNRSSSRSSARPDLLLGDTAGAAPELRKHLAQPRKHSRGRTP